MYDNDKLAARLPQKARAKFLDFVDELEARRAAASAASAAAREAAQDYFRQEQELLHSRHGTVTKTTGADGVPGYTSNPPRLAEDRAPRAVAAWHLWQRKRATTARCEQAVNEYNFVERLTAYVVEAGSLKDATANAAPKPKQGTHAWMVDGVIRPELAALDDEAAELELAPAPVDDLVTRAYAEIDRLGSAPRFDARIRGESPVKFGPAYYMPSSSGYAPDEFLARSLVALFAPELKAKVETFIRDSAPVNGMSDAERAARLAAIEDRKLELERQEEAHIVASEQAGTPILRRPDADPRAVLGVA